MLANLFRPTHLLLILIVVIIFWGPKRLPLIGSALGRSFREFRSGLKGKEQKPGR